MNVNTLLHFYKVANDVNNYVAMSSYNYYAGSMDGMKQIYSNEGFGDRFAQSLYSIGMPNNIVNIGYQIGQYVDVIL